MAYDPVLDREMFRPKAKSKGVEGLRESEDPAVLARREQALAMMEMAKQKFDPANYQTLGEQDRPGVFRPVAVNMPAQQPTADTATRMQQMAAQGIRPIAMAEGGIARHFNRGGMNNAAPRSYTLPEVISNWWTGNWGDTPADSSSSEDASSEDVSSENLDRTFTGDTAPTIPTGETETVIYPGPRGPSRQARPVTRPRTRSDIPGSLPSASQRGRSSGVLQTVPPEQKPEKKSDKKADSDYPTGIESIKAERERQREENFNMALIRAGLGMAAGKSSNALANIGEGGIAGLEQFAAAEKADRALNAEERKYQEDRASRIQRAAELLQEKQLTRETRILDIKTDENSRIDMEISRLGRDMEGALDEAQKSRIQAQIDTLQAQKDRNQRVIQQTMGRLGYEGSDLYGAAPGSAFGIGSVVTQNGVQYRVTGVDQNGRVTSAEPVE